MFSATVNPARGDYPARCAPWRSCGPPAPALWEPGPPTVPRDGYAHCDKTFLICYIGIIKIESQALLLLFLASARFRPDQSTTAPVAGVMASMTARACLRRQVAGARPVCLNADRVSRPRCPGARSDPRQEAGGGARHPDSRYTDSAAAARPGRAAPPQAPLGGSQAAISGPSDLRSRATGSPPGPAAPPMSLTARPRGQPAIASSTARRSAQGPPDPTPATPRSGSARPLRARTLCRAGARRFSYFF